MNAKHAVLKAYTLYAWVEQNALKYKSSYPVKELLSPTYYFRCPLCDYAGFSGRADLVNCVNHCPMYNQWPKENRPGDTCGACHSHPASCYNIWAEIVSDYSFGKPATMNDVPQTVYRQAMRNAGDVAAALWKRYKQLELAELNPC